MRLKIHQETQNAIAALKEGQLSEEEFWDKISKISNSDKQPLWKKFENERNKDEEAKASWEALKGKGAVSKKKQLLLHFLKTGRTQEGGLKQSQEVSDSKRNKNSMRGFLGSKSWTGMGKTKPLPEWKPWFQ